MEEGRFPENNVTEKCQCRFIDIFKYPQEPLWIVLKRKRYFHSNSTDDTQRWSAQKDTIITKSNCRLLLIFFKLIENFVRMKWIIPFFFPFKRSFLYNLRIVLTLLNSCNWKVEWSSFFEFILIKSHNLAH